MKLRLIANILGSALFTLLLLPVPIPVLAADLVVLVRHAEKADLAATDPSAKDPELSPAGRERAEALGSVLKDAKLTAVFSTDYKRTRLTAEPVARRFGLEVQLYDPKDTADLVSRLKAASGAVLVVGHSNTIPEALKALGIPEDVAISETEFDNLFLVHGANTENPGLIRLRYR